MPEFESISQCRCCGETTLEEILSLGEVPLSDGFVKSLSEQQPRYPLTLLFCTNCTLAQLKETVDPNVLFNSDYPYYSSFSKTWLEHCATSARQLIERLHLGQESLVVEIASNDGYMLRNFHKQGIAVLGIDPAPGPVKAAIEQGIDSVCRFFTRQLASELRRNSVQADLIIANNVLAHVADPHGFIDGICEVLKPDGMAVFEVPYLRNLIETGQFDTIYHEHLAYFSVRSVCELFERHHCSVVDVQKVPTHGGSLRLFIRNNADGHGPATRQILTEEEKSGMSESSWYQTFADAAKRVQQSLRETITSLKAEGKTIAAYGAAAKGTILLNTAGIKRHQLEYVVDRNVHKQGQFVPGIDLPILAPEKILETQPDYLLILPWNLKEEIIEQEKTYQERGGRFIVPLPELMFF